MSANTTKLEKILMLKKREKEESAAEYNQAVKEFEQVATKLYEALKKKEDLEANQMTQITKGLPINQVRQTQLFIQSLEEKIQQYQQLVVHARSQMQGKEQRLMIKNIEVKKFEKIKEKKQHLYNQLEKQEEKKLMDEISIQQYTNRGN